VSLERGSLSFRVRVTLRLTVSKSVCLGVEPTLWTFHQILLSFQCLGLKFVVLSLWRALSDERPGLSCVSQASRVQLRSHFKEKNSGSGLENREYGRGDRRGDRRADYATPLHPQKLALNSLTSGGRSVGTVCSRPHATDFLYCKAAVRLAVSAFSCEPLARPGRKGDRTRQQSVGSNTSY
jgi:hypothetical protein